MHVTIYAQSFFFVVETSGLFDVLRIKSLKKLMSN